MLPNVLFKTLRDQRRSLPFWGLGWSSLRPSWQASTPPSGTTTYFSRWWRPTLTS